MPDRVSHQVDSELETPNRATRAVRRRILHAVMRSWPIWVALAASVAVGVPPLLDALQPVQDCPPSWQIAGYCDPPSMASLAGMLGGVAVIFAVAWFVTSALRQSVRMVLRWRRRRSSKADGTIADEAGPSLTSTEPPKSGWSRNRRRAAAGLLAIAIFGAGIGVDRVGWLLGPPDPTEFGLIRQAWELLHTRYVRSSSLDSSKLAHAAIRAMAEAVGDTGHTSFKTADEAALEAEALDGSYVGIGVELDESSAMPVVSKVVADGPADHGGLRLGDVLLEIDGRLTPGMTDDDLTNALRGEAGTQVIVTVQRAAAIGTRTSLTITRGEVFVPVVEWAMVPGTQIWLISLTVFSDGAADQLDQAVQAVHAAGATGIVLDLRGNPGGFFNEGVYVASQFLSSGPVVQARDQSGVVRVALVVSDWLGDRTTPLVVLIDADSASASEMVASALQDAGRATLVGETTFGTGTGLGDYSLEDGSVLSIGILELLTRSGRSVWHTGVTPDVAIAMPDGVRPITPSELAALSAGTNAYSGDTQLAAAVRMLALGPR